MNLTQMLICLAIMAGITYLIRVLPITVLRKKITSIFIKSFLFYVPYAVLAALTFPAIFTATGNIVTSVVGTIVALIFAFFDLGLIVVAIGAVAGALLAVWFTEQQIRRFHRFNYQKEVDVWEKYGIIFISAKKYPISCIEAQSATGGR